MKNQTFDPPTLLVWDEVGNPPQGDWITVLWRSFTDDNSPNFISIPSLVEEKSDSLRSRYLSWIFEIGETNIKGKRVVDHLEIRHGFSYWWMTLITEKCNFSKSPQIDDAIKLIAFDDWASQQVINEMRLMSANRKLAECLKIWCAKRKVKFIWQRLKEPVKRLSWLRRSYDMLPYPLQALIWLVHYAIDRWPLSGIGVKEWKSSDANVTFVSYLFHLEPSALVEKRFESRYWTNLPGVLEAGGCKTNWLHMLMKDSLLPDVRKAAKALRDFNKSGRGQQIHVALDSFLDGQVLLKILQDWFGIARMSKSLENQVSQVTSEGLSLWPLFKANWRQSMVGKTAMSNVWHLNLYERAMKFLPKQRTGVYLQENMDWEFAFLWAWKAAGHGCINGCPHSMVRFWDLRYFFDPRSYNRARANPLPLPDKIAVNGSHAAQKYRNGGYPAEDLVEVEALRYLYLNDLPSRYGDGLTDAKKAMKLLVLGEFVKRNTMVQMRLLEMAAQSLQADIEITVKPHPGCPIASQDYPGLKFTLTMEPVSKLLPKCDMAYTSAGTSAAVDAYCAGVPVISVLDPGTLNLSPLRGINGVHFVSTPDELAKALTTAASGHRVKRNVQDFFHLDTDLPRWKKLLL